MFNKPLFRKYSSIIGLISRISDVLAVIIAAIFAYGIRFGFDGIHLTQDYKSLVLFAVLSVMLIFPLFNIYGSWRGTSILKQLRVVFVAWSLVIILMIAILFSLKISSGYSRLWLAWWGASGYLFLFAFRSCVYTFLHYQRLRGRNYKTVVIVGAGDLAKKLLEQALDSPWAGYKVLAFFDDNNKLKDTYINDIKVEGELSSVSGFLSTKSVDEIWIALPLRAELRVKELLFELRHHTVNIKLVPDIFGFSLLNHSLTEVVGLPAVNLSDTPMRGGNQLVKAVEDRVLGTFIFVLIAPLLLLIAIGIKLTSNGPILFKQKRHGWDGRIINVYKFRTMHIHQEKEGEITQASKNDARITKFGSFLRKTSLDELPQFYNVMQGRMSIVGPRPHAVEHNELYKDMVNRYMLRHMVKPGITGWAQVNGFRGETDTLDKMEKRVEYDLFYIENWSLWFDFKIILMTLFKGFVNKSAY